MLSVTASVSPGSGSGDPLVATAKLLLATNSVYESSVNRRSSYVPVATPAGMVNAQLPAAGPLPGLFVQLVYTQA